MKSQIEKIESSHFLPPLVRLFEDADAWFVGMDRMLADMAAKFDHAWNGFEEYPKSQVEEIDDNHFRVTLFLPDWDAKDLSVKLVDDELVISGEMSKKTVKKLESKSETSEEMRSFTQRFLVADEMNVEKVRFDDGKLMVDIIAVPTPTIEEKVFKIES